jgi:hypothetical protein
MNQQQFNQMQADMANMQGQLTAAQAQAAQAQAAANQAQLDNAAQAQIIAQQQIDLAAAHAVANQAVAAAAAAHAAANMAAVIPVGAPPVPPAGPPPPMFAVNAPGQVMGVIIFDSAGMKLHKSASAPLSALFDGKSAKLTAFINDLGTRARSFGWDQAIFTIGTVNGPKNMLENYSSITMDEIRVMAGVYSGTLPIATRGSQAATQVHLMLQDSLSPELKDRVIARRAEYTFTINNVTYEDGVAMLKVVFNLVAVDTKATVAVITRNLEHGHLATKLAEVDYDPVRFHLFVHEQILKLVQRNAPVPNIVGALFEAYKQVPDDAYTTWANIEYLVWEKPDSDNWSNEEVMAMAENRYHTIVQKGEWKVPTKHSEEIIALTARFDKAVAELKKRKLDPVAGTPNSRARRAPTDTRKFAWKNVAPADGEPREQVVEGKDYVHCPNHGDLQWVLKAGHINGCDKAPKAVTPKPKPAAAPAAEQAVVKAVVNALAAIAEDAE